MNDYHFVVEPDRERVITQVLTEVLSSMPMPPLASTLNNAIVDEIAKVDEDTVLYRIENVVGAMAGYVGLRLLNGSTAIRAMKLRPEFAKKFGQEIQAEIANFIESNAHKTDFL